MNRSTSGCWTCRIRHRKCDELRPECKECTDRTIKCHGYGPKPDWIGDEPLLKAELDKIKVKVKHHAISKRKSNAAREAKEAREAREARESREVLEQPPTPRDSGPGMSFRESHLLIHYLDYIFPLQYPYYVDKPQFGGRGWLFCLLMRSGPLNHAILTLSALHHHTSFRLQGEHTERELIEYHTRALQGLRQALSQHEANGYPAVKEQLLEFLACGSSLISLEIFRGGSGTWRPHLDALTRVVDGMSLWSRTTEEDSLQRLYGMENSQRFMIASVIWYDVLACTSIRTAPKIDLDMWLDGDIDLSCLMGCYNWVMIAIGEVATISAREPGVESSLEAPSVKRRLEAELTKLDSCTENPEPIAVPVSRVFATAALVELHTVCSHLCPVGDEVQNSVERVIYAIRRMPEGMSLRGLTWPICIAGSMASSSQQVFFDTVMELVLGVDNAGAGFSNCDTVWRIMKQCWQHRKDFPESLWNWRDAMESMGICTLLA